MAGIPGGNLDFNSYVGSWDDLADRANLAQLQKDAGNASVQAYVPDPTASVGSGDVYDPAAANTPPPGLYNSSGVQVAVTPDGQLDTAIPNFTGSIAEVLSSASNQQGGGEPGISALQGALVDKLRGFGYDISSIYGVANGVGITVFDSVARDNVNGVLDGVSNQNAYVNAAIGISNNAVDLRILVNGRPTPYNYEFKMQFMPHYGGWTVMYRQSTDPPGQFSPWSGAFPV